MSEFNNRINAQRQILRVVNRSLDAQEELFGLSSGALERWARVNNVDQSSALLALLHEAAAKLFFLSNKSQEQITDEYQRLSEEVGSLTSQIQAACSCSTSIGIVQDFIASP